MFNYWLKPAKYWFLENEGKKGLTILVAKDEQLFQFEMIKETGQKDHKFDASLGNLVRLSLKQVWDVPQRLKCLPNVWEALSSITVLQKWNKARKYTSRRTEMI